MPLKIAPLLVLSFMLAGCSEKFSEVVFGEEVQKVWGTGADDMWAIITTNEFSPAGLEPHLLHWNGSSATRIELPPALKQVSANGTAPEAAAGVHGETWLLSSDRPVGQPVAKHALLFSVKSDGSFVDHSDAFAPLNATDSNDVYSQPGLAGRSGLVFASFWVPKSGPHVVLFDGTVVMATGRGGGDADQTVRMYFTARDSL